MKTTKSKKTTKPEESKPSMADFPITRALIITPQQRNRILQAVNKVVTLPEMAKIEAIGFNTLPDGAFNIVTVSRP